LRELQKAQKTDLSDYAGLLKPELSILFLAKSVK